MTLLKHRRFSQFSWKPEKAASCCIQRSVKLSVDYKRRTPKEEQERASCTSVASGNSLSFSEQRCARCDEQNTASLPNLAIVRLLLVVYAISYRALQKNDFTLATKPLSIPMYIRALLDHPFARSAVTAPPACGPKMPVPEKLIVCNELVKLATCMLSRSGICKFDGQFYEQWKPAGSIVQTPLLFQFRSLLLLSCLKALTLFEAFR